MSQPLVRRPARPKPATAVVATGNVDWDEAVNRFLAEAQRKNLSPATIENYQWYLGGVRTKQFLTDHSIGTPAGLDANKLRDLEGELLRAGVSSGTVNTFHRILKNFLGFCIREGYGGSESVLAVKGPKLEQREPETFTRDEEKRLRAFLVNRPRDLMLVDLMLATGLRLQEVCKATVDDIVESPQGAFLRVRQGKGRKDRIVPLDTPGDKLSGRLKRFVEKTRPKNTAQTALFLTSRKDGADYAALTPYAVQTLFKRISRDTGIHVNPHKFRHTFSTRALSAGVDVMALQKALGHTTLAMVSRYVHYQADDLLAAWKQRRD
jgi:site-specific recombinase XerD